MKKIRHLLINIHWPANMILILLIIAGYAFWIVSKFYNLPFQIPETRLLLVLIPLTEFLFLSILIYIGCRSKPTRKNQMLWLLVFIFSIVNLIIVSLFRLYFAHPMWAGYVRVQKAIDTSSFIIALLFILVITSFYMAFLFYKNSPHSLFFEVTTFIKIKLAQIKSFWKQILVEEDPPSKVFTITFLTACFVIGLTLRLINLDGFPPHVDEYIHTHAVKLLMDGEKLYWRRAFFTVNIPVLISYLLLGVSQWTSRFPMVVLNMVGIFPLYALTKKINISVAILSVFLFSSSPWIIGASQITRDYAAAPILFFLPATLLFEILKWENLSNAQYFKKNWWRAVILLTILAHIILDRDSVLKIAISVYGVFGLIALLKIFKQNPPKWMKVGAPFAVVGLLVLLLERSNILVRFLRSGSIIYRWAPIYLNIILKSQVHHGYSWQFIGVFILLLSLIISIDAILNDYEENKFVVLFIFGNFLAIILYLTLFVSTPRLPARIRYGVLLEYWYVPLCALFLFSLFQLLSKLFRKRWFSTSLFIILILAFFINFSSINYLINFSGGSTNIITGNPHYIVEPAYQILKAELTEQDVLLTDFAHRYDEINDQMFPNIKLISYYSFVFREKRDPLTIVDEYQQGWLALSANTRFANYGIPLSSFVHNGKSVEYIGLAGDIYLWQWRGFP